MTSDRPDILLIDQLPDSVIERLSSAFTLHRYENLEALRPIAEKIRAVTTGGGPGVPPDIMAALPNLEVISVNGVGTDQIDLNEARRRKIGVATTTGLLSDDVADMAIGLMLAVKRQIVTNDRFVRSGEWAKKPVRLSHTIGGQKVGIAGFGHIGQAIAQRAAAFNTEIAYFNSRPRTESSFRFEPDLENLAAWCDILILAVSGGPRSANMVNAPILEALGPHGVLINISRGSVVDEDALISALREGTIAGAGLDVFQNEPNINDAFFTLENTVLQAHQASATQETRSAMGNLVVENLLAHFAGRPLLTPVI